MQGEQQGTERHDALVPSTTRSYELVYRDHVLHVTDMNGAGPKIICATLTSFSHNVHIALMTVGIMSKDQNVDHDQPERTPRHAPTGDMNKADHIGC